MTQGTRSAYAAAGAANRRGRWLMPCMALSSRQSLPGAVTGVLTTDPASSKVTGLDGLGTGGGGTGGTTGLSEPVRRTVEEPETRNALAGKTSLPALSAEAAVSA